MSTATTTAIVTHAHGLSIIDLIPGVVDSPTLTPLALPSRFPPSSIPRITISAVSGHAFLWCPLSTLVWEYDSRGRRVGEMSVGKGVKTVVALGKVEGRERVGLGCEAGWKLMEKGKEGKWALLEVFETGEAVVHLAGSQDGAFVAVATATHRVIVFALQRPGERTDIPEITSDNITHLAFSNSSSNALLITTDTDLIITKPPHPRNAFPPSRTFPNRTNPFGSDPSARLLDFTVNICIQPGRDANGSCAVLGKGGRVAKHTPEDPDTFFKIIEMGQPVDGVALYDLGMIVGWTVAGDLIIKNWLSDYLPPITLHFPQPILSLHVLPQPERPTRQSLAPSMTASPSTTRRILGESRNYTNRQTPPPLTHSLDKGKQPLRTAEIPRSKSDMGVKPRISLPVSSTTVNLRGEGSRVVSRQSSSGRERVKEGGVKAQARESGTDVPPISHISSKKAAPTRPLPTDLSQPTPIPSLQAKPSTATRVEWNDEPKTDKRVVSEPQSSSSRTVPPPTSLPRSASSSHHVPRPGSRGSAIPETIVSRAPPSGQSPVFEDDIAEEDEDVAEGEQDREEDDQEEEEEEAEPSVHLDWAKRDRQARPEAGHWRGEKHEEPNEELVFLRRQMARMQMDILRMNRDIRNDIKMAVKPLMTQLEVQRGMIERQQREIERLRCTA